MFEKRGAAIVQADNFAKNCSKFENLGPGHTGMVDLLATGNFYPAKSVLLNYPLQLILWVC